jgi:cytochrome c1
MPFHTKSMIAIAFLIVGIVAAIAMLALHGGQERKPDPKAMRRVHGIFGFFFFVLLVFLSFVGIRYVAAGQEELSARAVFHAVFAVSIFAVLVLKLLIVRFYRGLLPVVPTLGMIVFVLTILVFSSSAGYYFARSGRSDELESQAPGEPEALERRATTSGDVSRGSALYEHNCAFCHYADRTEGKLGPGLAGILMGEKLPASGRPATADNIILQLEEPIGTMPSFTSLSEQELADLIAYLETI